MIALIAALLIAPPPVVHTWKNSVLVGDWNEPANWDNGVPAKGDIAYLRGSNEGRVVTLKGTAASVAAVFGGDTLKVDGTTLTVTGDPSQATGVGTTQVLNGGRIDLAGPGKVLAGEIALNGGALDITGTGVNLSGRITGTGATKITGEVIYEDLAGLVFRSSTFENDGVIKATQLLEINPSTASPASDGTFEISGLGGRLLVRSSLTLGPASSVSGGPVELVGGTFTTQGAFAPSTVRTVFPATLALAGTAIVADGTGDGNVTNTGSVTVTGTFGTGATYTQSAGLTNVVAGAKLDKDVVLNGGTLKGKGTVRSLTNNGGIVEPGASPGTLYVAKDFAQTASGTLRIEVEPAEHDVLAVTGKATLGGTLEILGSPASPVRFLTASAVNGTWGTVKAPCGVSGIDALSDCPPPVVDPTPTPVTPAATPTPTPTPSPTPTPVAPKPKQASVVFPTRCRHRSLKVRVSGDVRRATIKVNGKKAKTLKRAGSVTLHSKGKTKVAVAVTLTDGRTLTRTKTYRTC